MSKRRGVAGRIPRYIIPCSLGHVGITLHCFKFTPGDSRYGLVPRRRVHRDSGRDRATFQFTTIPIHST